MNAPFIYYKSIILVLDDYFKFQSVKPTYNNFV